MAKIKTLKDSGGNSFYPQTHIKGIVDDNGNNLDAIFSEQEKQLDSKIAEHSTVRFDGIVEDEITINTGTTVSIQEIVYSRLYNKFVAFDGNSYWDTWDGMEAYMSGGKIREDKVYLCGSELYTLSGSELISLISTQDKLKISGVFSYLSNAPLNIVLSKFLKSIKIYGISKDRELSFWDAKRNVEGKWVIRFVYTNPEYGNYVINYSSVTEENNIHIENTIYIDSRLCKFSADISVDWEAITNGSSLSIQSRTDNTIDTYNYADVHTLKSLYLAVDNIPETDIEAKKFVDFFKKIEIFGNYSMELSPFNITRNKSGMWGINFLDTNGSTSEYALSVQSNGEEEHLCARIDDTSFMLLDVDWDVIDNGTTQSSSLPRTRMKLSSNCYKRFNGFNNLSGKRILIFGDSITALKRENNNGEEKSYSNILEELTGCKIYNAAIGGTRLSRRTSLTTTPTNSTEAYAALDVVELVKAFYTGVYTYQDAANDWLLGNGQSGVAEQLDMLKRLSANFIDYIFISAGTNDAQWASMGDIDDEKETTLFGSINLISKYALGANRDIKMFAFTPIVRYFTSADDKASWGDRYIPTDGNYMTLAQVVSCIAKGWRRNHIPVADMYWSLGINEQNFSQFFPATDSTHPNYYGLERMAVAIKDFVNSFPSYREFEETPDNRIFDRLIQTNYRFNYLVSRFFKKVRIIGAPETLRITIWDIHRGTQDGKWSIKMLEYDESPDASGGYICTISETEEKSLLKGTISGDRGTIEMCVDWSVFGESTGIGANNRYTSRFALTCYDNSLYGNLSNTDSKSFNNYFVGIGSGYTSVRIDGLIPNHSYRIHIRTTWEDSTDNTNAVKFAINSFNATTKTELRSRKIGGEIPSYLDINIPSDSEYIEIGGRANIGEKVWFMIEDLWQKKENDARIGVTLVNTYGFVPNINTETLTLDLGDDPVLVVGNKSYALRSLHEEVSIYRAISIVPSNTTSGALVLVFNLDNKTIYTKAYNVQRDANEVILGGIRLYYSSSNNSYSFKSANLAFGFTVDAETVADLNGGIDELTSKFTDLCKRKERYGDATYGNKICNIIFTSDAHNSTTSLQRTIDFKNVFSAFIDDILHTGDCVRDQFVDDNPFATIDGGEFVLNTIGNHDVLDSSNQTGEAIDGAVPQKMVYDKFISPYISKWGDSQNSITQPDGAEEYGYCYYCKDYTESKVRLVVLDCMNYDERQNAWLSTILDDAISNGFHVIISSHYTPSRTYVPDYTCTFSSCYENGDSVVSSCLPNMASETVQGKIENGLSFICWLFGHYHRDFFGSLSNYPEQFGLAVDKAGPGASWERDCCRSDKGKERDAFNVVSVDTSHGFVTVMRIGNNRDKFMRQKNYLVFDYVNSKIVYNS